MKNVEKETVTFRIPVKKRAELDLAASEALRDRSYVLNEAVDAYLETRRWQTAHIEEGVRDADARRFATDDEIERAYRGK